jgi:L-lactate dehydrogenase (cytochrome)
VHAPSIIAKTLTAEQVVGVVDAASTTPLIKETLGAPAPAPAPDSFKPPLSSLLSLHDFEDVARKNFTAKAFAFYSSAATDLVSHEANRQCHRALLLRPRVLRNVKDVSIKRRILGNDSSAPFFVSPAAMARLAHSEGELAIARGCGAQGIVHIVRSNPGTCVDILS